MIELRTFGALDLRGPDGRELRAILAQPKRLALLAYLAAATPGPVHRRDTLIALFWPDHDLTRARAALSRAAHYLRASLGDGVLISRGDDELGLAPDQIFCDAVRFRELVSEGRLVEALELHRGEFLEGFFISDAPELERWIETERREFRESAAAAARSVSQSAESKGELALALHWARQAASYAPYDEADARRVITLLERTGEHAAAVEYFQRFARRLRDELDVEPSAETTAAIHGVQGGGVVDPLPERAPTPQGVGVVDPVPASVPSVPRARSRARWRVAALAVIPAVVIGASLVWSATSNEPSPPSRPARVDEPRSASASIAVLPLASLSTDSSNEYFSDGMTDELIAALSQVEGLRVAARTSSFVYKNRSLPVKDVARALNVDAVLEGSARQEGNRLRITLQLVRARDGYNTWAKTYQGERRDVFALQDEISRDVADALKVRLVAGSTSARARARTTDPETYDLYLWGRYHWTTRTPEGLLKAVQFFNRAVARDSTYAPAYVGIANSYNLLASHDVRPREIMPKAKAAALRALALDETQGAAHTALAYVATWYEWDWPAADRHFRRALALNASDATAHHWYSIYLSATGRLTESLAEMDRARELDPAAIQLRGAAGVRLVMARQYPRAIQQLEQVLKLGPGSVPATPWLGVAYLRVGRVHDAITLLERSRALHDGQSAVTAVLATAYAAAGRDADARALVHSLESQTRRTYFPRTSLARAYAVLGDKPRALSSLEQAYEDRDGWLIFLKVDPTFDALRDEPRFRALLVKMGLQ